MSLTVIQCMLQNGLPISHGLMMNLNLEVAVMMKIVTFRFNMSLNLQVKFEVS